MLKSVSASQFTSVFWILQKFQKVLMMFRILSKELYKYSRLQKCPCRLLNSPRKEPAARDYGPKNYFLLVIPATCLCLAYWQVKRKKWKEDLIAQLKQRCNMEPIELPKDFSELKNLELYPVKVRGHFDYTNEVYIGPRTGFVETEIEGQAANYPGLQPSRASGVHVITPFKLTDRDLTILVNRGWYDDAKFISKEVREKGQIHGEQELVGVIRNDQDTSAMFWKFMMDFDHPQKKKGCDVYCVRKLDLLAERCGTAPVYMDAKIVRKSQFEPKPVELGIELRNEHLSYIFTWLSLAVVTTSLWYFKYCAPARSSGVNSYLAKQTLQKGSNKTKS